MFFTGGMPPPGLQTARTLCCRPIFLPCFLCGIWRKPPSVAQPCHKAFRPTVHTQKNCPPLTRSDLRKQDAGAWGRTANVKLASLRGPVGRRPEDSGGASGVLAFFCEVASSQICPLGDFWVQNYAFSRIPPHHFPKIYISLQHENRNIISE